MRKDVICPRCRHVFSVTNGEVKRSEENLIDSEWDLVLAVRLSKQQAQVVKTLRQNQNRPLPVYDPHRLKRGGYIISSHSIFLNLNSKLKNSEASSFRMGAVPKGVDWSKKCLKMVRLK